MKTYLQQSRDRMQEKMNTTPTKKCLQNGMEIWLLYSAGIILRLRIKPQSSEFSIQMTFHNPEEIFPITFEKPLYPDENTVFPQEKIQGETSTNMKIKTTTAPLPKAITKKIL